MNEFAAKVWLEKAWHNLSAAKVLFEANHFSDVIAVEIHYALEKIFKAYLAYENRKIPRTHDLVELSTYIEHYRVFEDKEIDILEIASDYHIEAAYPVFERSEISYEELSKVIDFTQNFFDQTINILGIKI